MSVGVGVLSTNLLHSPPDPSGCGITDRLVDGFTSIPNTKSKMMEDSVF
ncbi:hypothetical protein [Aquimarina sp. 2201CG5-10]|nr:hypothetical protein [Aquimarina sp. 2201CG5-10]MDY8138697.1 hypothetical protein [Aquimarina sp. 2201CG5-10]